MDWLAHASGDLATSKDVLGYWFSESPETKVAYIERLSREIFYPFGKIEPFFELKENLSVETLQKLAPLFVKKRRLFFFTDTHEKTYYIYKYLASTKNLHLLILDAHPDCFGMDHKEPVNYQNFVKKLVENNVLKPDQITIVGLRNPAIQEIEFLDSYSISYYTIIDIYSSSDRVLSELQGKLGSQEVYLSLDLDALSCKACNWIEPFGIPEQFLLRLILNLKNQIKILDITELNWNAPHHEKTYYLKLGLYLILLVQAVKPWQRL